MLVLGEKYFSFAHLYINKSVEGVVASTVEVITCSPPIGGVPSLHPDHFKWVSWWAKWGLSRFFPGFLPFYPAANFILPLLHTHLINLISSTPVIVHQAWSAGSLAIH